MMKSKIGTLAKEQGFKTPEQLSKKTGLTRTTLYNIWSGDLAKRQLMTLFIISDILNVGIGELFEIAED